MKKLDEMESDTLSRYADESAYALLKLKYGDRQALAKEVQAKKAALAGIKPENPFYHRVAMSAELAQQRLDMAHIVAENIRLHDMIETISWLHQQVDILQGAYGHVKMLAESSRIDYRLIAKGINDIIKIKEELSHEVSNTSHQPDGPQG